MSMMNRFRRSTNGGAAALLALVIVAGCALASCSPESLVGNAPLPPDVPDPAQTHTAAGAVEAYHGALQLFRSAVGGDQNSMVPVSGLLTDKNDSRRTRSLPKNCMGCATIQVASLASLNRMLQNVQAPSVRNEGLGPNKAILWRAPDHPGIESCN